MTIRAIGSCMLLIAVSVTGVCAQEEKKRPSSVFVVSPMAGVIKSETLFGSGPTRVQLTENGSLQGVNLLYANSSVTIGNLIHNSKTPSSTENGYLLYANWYLNGEKTVQPMVGVYAEYVTVYSQLSGRDSAPFNSLDVNNAILALQPVAGVSITGKSYRITPFAGYFNEQVETSVSSPGMRIAGQTRNGIKSSSTQVLDYASFGSKFEFTFFHALRLDAKFYYRTAQGQSPLLTTRNRLDFFFSRTAGLSLKFDYFQDKVETTTFAFLGPSFVF